MSQQEAWYQIADLKLGLLPSVRVHKQQYRGETWYVLQDLGSDKFFRLKPYAYRFVCELTPDETVAEVWNRALADYPEDAPGQDEVSQLLSQMHHANLLFFRSDADHEAVFERFRKQRTRERMGWLMAMLYLRVPLINPDRFLERHRRWVSAAVSPGWLALWLLSMVLFAKLVVENWDRVWSSGQGLLAPGNLPLLYLSIFVLKIFHEFAHAFVCKRYGGRVHTMGLMFIVFTPLPYIDAGSSWSMRSRWQRAYVGSAGMIIELFLASLAAWVWAYTGSGLVNSMAFNLMLAGSISALVFNGNPLLRFDAYYVLIDLLEMPNLYQKAAKQWFYYGDRFLYGTTRAESPARNARERAWFTLYGLASVAYRLFVMVAITFLVADIWLGLGAAMVVMMCFIWILIPGGRLVRYLVRSPRLVRNRQRAVVVTVASVVGLIAILARYPVPASVKSPGVVLSEGLAPVYVDFPGRLLAVHVRDGEPVARGQLLVEFAGEELEHEATLVDAQIREAEWLYRQSLTAEDLDSEGFLRQLEALQARLATLTQRIQGLHLRAPSAGIWQGQGLEERLGTHNERGALLGQVVDTGHLRFSAVLSQAVTSKLFDRLPESAELRLLSQNVKPLRLTDLSLLPTEQHALPSPSLGLAAGGPIHTRLDARGNEIASESFYELRVPIPEDAPLRLAHGMTGYLKIQLQPSPVLEQVWLALRQTVQRRYGL